MRNLLPSLVLLAACGVMQAQVSVSVPVATSTTQGVVQPGKTMSIANGILDCIPASAANISYSATTGLLVINGVQVNTLTLNSATFNGVPAPGNGTYLVTFTGGVEGYTAYTPSGGTTPTAPAGKAYTVTLPTTNGTSYTLVPGLTVAAGQTYSITPVFTGAPATTAWYYYSHPFLYVNSAGAAYVGLANATSTAIANASVTVVVK